LLNEGGFITGAGRSLNCAKFRFGLTTFLLFTQAVPSCPYAPSLSYAFGAWKKSGVNLRVHYRDSGVVGLTTNHYHRPTLPSHKSSHCWWVSI